jgi:hypothetical protein
VSKSIGLVLETGEYITEQDIHAENIALKKRIADLEGLSGVNSAQIKLLGDWLNARDKSIAELEADKAELVDCMSNFCDKHENHTPARPRVVYARFRLLVAKYQQPAKGQES